MKLARRACVALVILTFFAQNAEAGQRPVSGSDPASFGHTLTELWDVTASAPSPGQTQGDDSLKGYGLLGSDHGSAEFDQKKVDPIPADGSILAGGAVVTGRAEQAAGKSVTAARVAAWVRADDLELLGGSAKGGITIQHLLVKAAYTCGAGLTTADTIFSGLQIAGKTLASSPPVNTVLHVGTFTVLLNERHVNDNDLGVTLTGVHILADGITGALGATDVRIGALTTEARCPRPPAPTRPDLALQLSTQDRQPIGTRVMRVLLRLRNASTLPCRLTSVEFHPGGFGWVTAATSGALGTSFRTSYMGDAELLPTLTLAPGAQVEQTFVVMNRPGNPPRLRAGSQAQGTCLASGTWGSALGAFPRS